MIEDALAAGLIGPGSTIVESTSGNLGVGLARACLGPRLPVHLRGRSRTDIAKLDKMMDLGGEVRIVSEPDPVTGDLLVASLTLVNSLVAEIPGAWRPDQYSNQSNPAAHRETMAEIAAALDGEVDWLFVATSTTGTLRGCCDYIAGGRTGDQGRRGGRGGKRPVRRRAGTAASRAGRRGHDSAPREQPGSTG